MNSQQTPTITNEQKYCSDCGDIILRKSEICPNCGCRQIVNIQTGASIDAGSVILLLVLNFFWNGLGNVAVGDKNGWIYIVINIFLYLLMFIGIGVLFVMLFYVFCGYLGYTFLKKQHKTKT